MKCGYQSLLVLNSEKYGRLSSVLFLAILCTHFSGTINELLLKLQ